MRLTFAEVGALFYYVRTAGAPAWFTACLPMGDDVSSERGRRYVRCDAMRASAPLVLGYSLYAAANSAGYLSAMGTVEANLGFVSQLPFMMASCAAQVLVAVVIALRSRAHALAEGRLFPCTAGYVLLLLGGLVPVVLGALLPEGASLGVVALVALGVLRGVGSLLASVAWYELLVVYVRMSVPAVMLLVSALHALMGMALGAVPSGGARQVLMVGLYVASWVVARRVPAMPAGEALPVRGFSNPVSLTRGEGRGFAGAWLCLLVCQFVVGVANTAVFESPFASTLAGVNVDACILVATAVLAVLFVAARHLPEPEATFKVVMPVLLAAFTATALAAGEHGSAMAYAMIACYEAIAITYSVYLVQFVRRGRYRLHAFVALTSGTASLTLLLGLAIGVGLNVLSNNHGVPLYTLLAFVAIYPLGLAFLVIQRNRMRAGLADAGEEASGADAGGAGASEDAFARRVAAFSRDHALTPRETELAALLVRGHTVKAIGEDLGITENTAWTHIRSIYAKCGVRSKQALIDLFDSDVV